jgi:Flp pilus assembly protein TadD
LSVFVNVQLGLVLLIAGRTAQAIAQVRKAIELDPHFALAHWILGCAHASESRHEDALAELEAVELSNRLPAMVAALAAGYAEAGRAESARRLLAELRARAAQQYVPAQSFAVVCAAVGETDEALAWLERACNEHDVTLAFLRDRLRPAAAFGLPSLRGDSRYRALLRRVGLE